MKAFQLKIMIKNSKPPIWRRVVVPSGITFSQLSIILNEVMGWCGYHVFQFEFYHQELLIMEDAAEFADHWRYDYLEASTTLIREFLEENAWFTYTYDMGDDWQHRVTIEKILDDWELDYPQVLKYKGDCPVEDCGGIGGYYDCLAIIGDKNHPEYEERLAWMHSQGYPNTYDIDHINEKLKNELYYKLGKAEKRCQNKIYEELFKGEYGLKASSADKKQNLKPIKSSKHKTDESLQQIADMVKEFTKFQAQLQAERSETTSLKEIFDDYEKTDLIEIAKDKGITGLSGKSKKQLIEKLYCHMTQEEEIQKYFYCMSAEVRNEFQKAIDAADLYEPDKPEYLMELYRASYIGMLADGRIIVPKEIKDAYLSKCSSEFEKECDKRSFVLACLQTVKWLYGIIPFDIFVKLVNTRQGYSLSEKEVLQIIEEIPAEYMEYAVHNDKVYYREFYPDDRGLLKAQGNKSYYIPPEEEIMDIGLNAYPSKDKYVQQFKKYLKNGLEAMDDEADYACAVIYHLMSDEREFQEIFAVLEDLGLMPDTEQGINTLIQKLGVLWNNTRKIIHRGYTPKEMEQIEKSLNEAAPVMQKVISFEAAKKNKVYPNDPCPCGSGKKYKNCCKNKK